MVKEFQDLEVWKNAKQVVISIYKFTRDFPKQETYGLTNQLRRAVNSICANIAEGFNRFHHKDKIKFYYNARGSISECKSHLLISQELGYLEKGNVNKLIEELDIIGKMLNAMINSLYLRHSSPKPQSPAPSPFSRIH